MRIRQSSVVGKRRRAELLAARAVREGAASDVGFGARPEYSSGFYLMTLWQLATRGRRPRPPAAWP